MADSILLIDDDVEILRALGTHLERAGYDVSRELSGEAGLGTFDRLRPDVVVLDLGLSGMGGAGALSGLWSLLGGA
jgi:two-component system KDP operon response regulator KdpE